MFQVIVEKILAENCEALTAADLTDRYQRALGLGPELRGFFLSLSMQEVELKTRSGESVSMASVHAVSGEL